MIDACYLIHVINLFVMVFVTETVQCTTTI